MVGMSRCAVVLCRTFIQQAILEQWIAFALPSFKGSCGDDLRGKRKWNELLSPKYNGHRGLFINGKYQQLSDVWSIHR